MKTPKSIWVKGAKKLYLDACKAVDYPNVPMGKYFDKNIKASDTILDIGCGFGVASLYLKDKCRHITAFDFEETALEHLNNEIRTQNINNITTVSGVFPNMNIEPCDVTIALYVFGILKDLESAKALLSVTKREGFIICSSSKSDVSFKANMLKELGKNADKEINLLQSLGAKVECIPISHQFGQPVDSIEDAVTFFLWQLNLDDSYKKAIRDIAPKYISEKDGKPYIEIIRNSNLLHFYK